MSNNLGDIRDYYLRDVSYIRDYVQFLETFFLTSMRMIDNIDQIAPSLFKTLGSATLCENNASVEQEMTAYLIDIQDRMRSLELKEKSSDEPSMEDSTPEGDMLLYLTTKVRNGATNREELFRIAQAQVEALCIVKGDQEGFEGYHDLYDNPQKVRRLVEIAFEEEDRRLYEVLKAEGTYIGVSAKSLELFDSKQHTNLYKQNFIQTMAYFDSCIFDMVRLCMDQNFFEWLSYFANVNIKTHEISSYGSFEVFKESQIDASLRKSYVKDLLNILKERFDGVFNVDGYDIYPTLQEMIARRNVHIHHNGIADEKYCAEYNLYCAELGDYLEVDREYFEKVVELTQLAVCCIANVCG